MNSDFNQRFRDMCDDFNQRFLAAWVTCYDGYLFSAEGSDTADSFANYCAGGQL